VTTFNIEARDLYNNRIREGGESFIITIGLLEEGRYEDNGDGTYLGIYTVTSSGVFDLRVRNDQEIVRNPLDYFDTIRQAFRLRVLPGPISPPFCSVYGGGMQGVTAGYQGIFYVQVSLPIKTAAGLLGYPLLPASKVSMGSTDGVHPPPSVVP
jgi:hypothetical protein